VGAGLLFYLYTFDGVKKYMALAGDAADKAALVYGGSQAQERDTISVYPWQQIQELFNTLDIGQARLHPMD
jgi:hypothetical protein